MAARKPCKCGSTTHQRTNHSQCPLNKARAVGRQECLKHADYEQQLARQDRQERLKLLDYEQQLARQDRQERLKQFDYEQQLARQDRQERLKQFDYEQQLARHDAQIQRLVAIAVQKAVAECCAGGAKPAKKKKKRKPKSSKHPRPRGRAPKSKVTATRMEWDYVNGGWKEEETAE
ncbi:MAG: hypothetical protein CMD74_02610 [Gammaproteobacteria bacterium]|nr:hypothetical protein [Gammaproteobacteria bacterium]